MRNITFDLIENAERRPDARALLVSGTTITYGELNELTWKAASHLHGAGVRKGDVVGLTFTDQIDLALAMLATIRLGATVFSIPPSSTPHQRSEMAARASASMLVTDASDGRFDAGIPTRVLSRAQLEGVIVDPDVLDPEPEAPCLLVYGSGTTGNPKLFALSHAFFKHNSMIASDIFRKDENQIYMRPSVLSYTGSKRAFFSMLATGGTFSIASEQNIISEIAEFKPDILHLTVFHAEKLLNAARKGSAFDLSEIRITCVGASVVSEDLRRRLKEVNANVHINYQTNETSCIAFAQPDDIATAPGTVGRPPKGVSVEIVDDEHRLLSAGRVGQVRVKSPAAITRYHDGSDADRFRDGWFYPGDLAMWSEDGQLIYYGRSDHMMIMNGINIYPAEIERVLVDHPAVRDAAAVPLKHPVHQDIPVCAVALHPGATAEAGTLQAFARERLGARAPRLVFVFDAIPRNGHGKLVRARLADMIRRELESRSHSRSGMSNGAEPSMPLRQLMTPVPIKFTVPEHVPAEQLDAWMKILCPGHSFDAPESDQPATPVASWLRCILLIARELLQVARIPVLDEPRVMSCQQASAIDKTGTWNAVVGFARLDHMPGQIFERALKGARSAVTFALENPVNDANRQALFALLEREALAELRKVATPGKSTLPVLQAAHARGIPFIHLGAGVYQLGWGSRAKRIDRSTTDADSAMGVKLSSNKILTARLLAQAGLPHPHHQIARSMDEAKAAARRIGWPVVVKPADRERGEGVSVDVADASALEKAFTHAMNLSQGNQVIVERQVEGVCHRLFIAHGRLLYAVKRMPMGVWADGARTIRDLVADEWSRQRLLPPWRRSEIQPIDDLARASLQALGHDDTAIPASGTFVPLRRIETTAWGGVDEDVSSRVHPENLRVAAAAARLFGLSIAGIDIITPDIGVPWHENAAIINEVNFAPLLGGGEISRRHIPDFLGALIEGDGRIPVHLHVGAAKAFDSAQRHWRRLRETGVRAALSNADRTWTSSGETWPMPFEGLYRRSRAIVLSPDVDAMVLVVQTDEFLETGLPLEAFTSIHEAGDGLVSRGEGRPLDEGRAGRLRSLLRTRAIASFQNCSRMAQIPANPTECATP